MLVRALLVLLLCGSVAVPALAATKRESQRQQFQQALDALNAEDMAGFYRLEPALRSYVLHPYLRFKLGERVIAQASPDVAKKKALQLEGEFHGDALAWRSMRAYSQRLRDEQSWQALIDSASMPSAPKLRCETLRAREQLLQLQPDDAVLASLWQQRTWQPDCAWVVQRHLAAGGVAVADLWQHIYALMDVGRLQQVEEFKQYFNARDRALIDAWVAGHAAPQAALNDARWQADTALNRRVFKHLISRLSRLDAKAARLQWGRAHLAERYDLATRTAAARTQSLRAASDYIPEALDWLKWLPEASQDTQSREAYLRLAVRLGRWQAVLDAEQALTAELADASEWRYWGAVARWQLGDRAGATARFRDLAAVRSYYGFLAADRLQLPYQMHDQATVSDKALRTELQSRVELQRMREYLFVGLRAEAVAQWRALLKTLNIQQRVELSLLLLDWGWFDRAIATNGRTGLNDDLRVRFPLAYRDSLQMLASQRDVPLAWAYGVARRESLFQPDVRSGAGAIGLMQLMPDTARDVARRMKKKLYTGALQNPEFNLSLGVYYLRYLLDRFEQHPVLATASYNAGMSRVPKWLAAQPMAADRWVESIPFRETRDYLKAVMAYAVVYDWRLDGRVDAPLSVRMPPLPAAAGQ